MHSDKPLAGIRVLEFAGLAPAPFTGLLLADYGASVLRIDRPHSTPDPSTPPSSTSDLLTRRKASIAVDVKSPNGKRFLHALLPHVDILIDPYRPGVLEALSLGPNQLCQRYSRLIIARLTGFRRNGKYAKMAGHDINYLAVSGVLSMLGRAGERPYAPGNILADFAGGGATCFMGILTALYTRTSTGRGQVVEMNMVDGSAYLATWPRLAMKTPIWNRPRGENVLDGGCPYYDVYETRDGGYMAVGALEPLFFSVLLRLLSIPHESVPGPRTDPATWPYLRDVFTQTFKSKTRAEWEVVFDGSDACVTPVLSQSDLENRKFQHGMPFALRAAAEGDDGQGEVDESDPDIQMNATESMGLAPGEGGEAVLKDWVGWQRSADFDVDNGGLVKVERSKL
ncbi:MAG: hypothetical protein M1833_001854 [Piccolia ochrophora]|nr:MAG: hypothetical protein M1833_001854 [Piccolia ochrophora]